MLGSAFLFFHCSTACPWPRLKSRLGSSEAPHICPRHEKIVTATARDTWGSSLILHQRHQRRYANHGHLHVETFQKTTCEALQKCGWTRGTHHAWKLIDQRFARARGHDHQAVLQEISEKQPVQRPACQLWMAETQPSPQVWHEWPPPVRLKTLDRNSHPHGSTIPHLAHSELVMAKKLLQCLGTLHILGCLEKWVREQILTKECWDSVWFSMLFIVCLLMYNRYFCPGP